MSASNDSIGKTLTVALVLCLFCSVVVSSSAVLLKPLQKVNEETNMQINILSAAGLYDPEKTVSEQFDNVTTKLVRLSSGEFESEIDSSNYDQRMAAKDFSRSREIAPDDDIALIKRQADVAKVYLIETDEGQIDKIIIPIHGYGLWSTLYGFLALEGDANTVSGLGFYEHSETPGLGGEVDNSLWKSQWTGKKIYSGDDVGLHFVKGGADPTDDYQIDALSGASLTTRGVSNMIHFWLSDSGFKPFLDRVRRDKS